MESEYQAIVLNTDADVNRVDCKEQALGEESLEELMNDTDNESELEDSKTGYNRGKWCVPELVWVWQHNLVNIVE